jgi:hypothetical protein
MHAYVRSRAISCTPCKRARPERDDALSQKPLYSLTNFGVLPRRDMTIGGFYKHFESKNALVEEVFSLTFEQSSSTWRQVSERKYDDPADETLLDIG